jgi:hypothetical protein
MRKKILPDKLNDLIHLSATAPSDQVRAVVMVKDAQFYAAESFHGKTGIAIAKLAEEICITLMYFFILPLLPGLYYHFRADPETKTPETFISLMFIITNIILMVLLYINYGYLDRRHCLPLAVYLIFYVPTGLELLAQWISSMFLKEQFNNSKLWFFVLLIIGIVISLPKLFKPIRIEKQAFRTAAQWIKENTSPEEVIGFSSSVNRISFYAERANVLISNNSFPPEIRYIVEGFKKDKDKPLYHKKIEEKYDPVNQWETRNIVIVFYSLKN